MPMLFNYSCVPDYSFDRSDDNKLKKVLSKSCDFSVKDDGPHVYLKLDGREIGLDQHNFIANAETLAKKSFRELIDSRMIIYKKEKICLNCLKFEEDCICESKKLIPIRELEGMKCPKCKEGKIEKVSIAIS